MEESDLAVVETEGLPGTNLTDGERLLVLLLKLRNVHDHQINHHENENISVGILVQELYETFTILFYKVNQKPSHF